MAVLPYTATLNLEGTLLVVPFDSSLIFTGLQHK